MGKYRFKLIKDGITETAAEAVVNAANTGLHEGTGVCGTIFNVAGREKLRDACGRIGFCKEGDAVITPGFDMKSKWVIHAVGPHWHGGHVQDWELLKGAYTNSLRQAVKMGIKSVVFPLIGTGAFGWPVKEGCMAAVDAICAFIRENPNMEMLIMMSVPDDGKRETFRKVATDRGLMKKDTDTTEREDFVFFWKDNEKNGFMSQWYRLPFTIDGIEYNCCEQYMMAKKALMMGDVTRYILIMNADIPVEMKRLGRDVVPFDSEKWEQWKRKIVFDGNMAKFLQNPEYAKKLLNTGDAVLAEASPKDPVYGIMLSEDDPDSVNPAKWKGENILGYMLMEVRTRLRYVSTIEETHIENEGKN